MKANSVNWLIVILAFSLAAIAYRYRVYIRLFVKWFPLVFRTHRAQKLKYLIALSVQEARFDVAERYSRRLLKLQEKIHGEDSPELCPTLETLSHILMAGAVNTAVRTLISPPKVHEDRNVNKQNEAAKILVRSGLIQMRYAERLHDKARELSSQGNYTEAEKCYLELREKAENDLMPVDQAVSALKGYAVLLNIMNRQGEIAAVLELSRTIQARK